MANDNLGEIILKNVRLSYPHIYEPYESENDAGEKTAKFRAKFLIPKNDPEGNMKKWKAARAQVEKEQWPTKAPKLSPDRLAMRDGDELDGDESDGHYVLSASTPSNRPPSIVTNRKDKEGKWISPREGEKGAPYGGCYVNAIVRVWAQDNKYGKRINCSLESVQFLRDGEAFGAGRVDPNDKFTDDDVSTEGSFGDDEDDDDSVI